MVTQLDRYLAKQEWRPLLATLAVVVLILSLENVSRLWDFVSGTNAPFRLMVRLMLALLPEYLAVALPLASYIAPAWAFRALATRGEWQIFPAMGLSQLRMMRAPLLLAALAALAQLSIRLDVEPFGERALDAISHDIREGVFGLPFKLDEFIRLDDETVLYAEPADGGGQGISRIFITRGNKAMAAGRAFARSDESGRIEIVLEDGVEIDRAPDGRLNTLHFSRYRMSFLPEAVRKGSLSLSERLDRMSSYELAQGTMREAAAVDAKRPMTSALLARVSSALFCLVLPWLALILAVPPKRQGGGTGAFIGIGAVVLFMRTSQVVETGFAAHPLPAAAVHMALWAVAAFALYRWASGREAGFIDLAIARFTSRLAKPFRRRASGRASGGT